MLPPAVWECRNCSAVSTSYWLSSECRGVRGALGYNTVLFTAIIKLFITSLVSLSQLLRYFFFFFTSKLSCFAFSFFFSQVCLFLCLYLLCTLTHFWVLRPSKSWSKHFLGRFSDIFLLLITFFNILPEEHRSWNSSLPKTVSWVLVTGLVVPKVLLVY